MTRAAGGMRCSAMKPCRESVPLDSEKATTLQGRIRRYSKEWLTLLDHSGVPPTSSLAEQAVRCLVILRKVTLGSRTRAGSRRLGVMMTVIQTVKWQGKKVLAGGNVAISGTRTVPKGCLRDRENRPDISSAAQSLPETPEPVGCR